MGADVPHAARGPSIDPDKGYLVEDIYNGFYYVTDGDTQAAFVPTFQGVILLDAPPALAPYLRPAIAEVTDADVRVLVYSHSHYDHIGAAHEFPGATIIAHAVTAETLQRRADPRRPMPQVTFRDSYQLDWGGCHMEMTYHGPNHEAGNTFIWAPRAKVLMAIDIVTPGWVPFWQLSLASDIPGLVKAHDVILGYPFTTFIGGHLTRLGNREDVHVAQEYLRDAWSACDRARRSVGFEALGSDLDLANPWQVARVYFSLLAREAAAPVEQKWVKRLGGVDVFTEDHCWAMIMSLAHDWGIEPGA